MSSRQFVKPFLFILIASSVLLAWSAYLASARSITGAELNVFRYINNWPDELKSSFWIITQFGSVWMLFLVTLAAMAKQLNRLALRVFVAGTIAFVLAEVIGQIIVRPRPAALIADVHLRNDIAVGYGFPSVHTTLATAASLVLLPVLPRRWRWLVVVWIVLVGLSRIYLGVHAPLDVVGGFAVGTLVASASYIIKNKLQFVTKITHLKLTK